MCVCVFAGADAAVLRTTDGKSYEGEVFLEPGNSVSVATGEGNKESVPLSKVAFASFTTLLATLERFGLLAEGWTNLDVGAVSLAGTAGQSNRTMAVRVGSGDIGGVADSFHFVCFRTHGDVEVVARIVAITGADKLARAGVMLRDSLKPDAKFSWIAVNADGELSSQTRADAGAKASPPAVARQLKLPCWLKLSRRDKAVTLFESGDGKEWTEVAASPVSLQNICYSGLAVAAHGGLNVGTAFIDEVRRNVHGVNAEYFADRDFTKLKTNRLDTLINFGWSEALLEDTFSIRWTGELEPVYTENYTFHFDAMGEAKLWVKDQSLPHVPYAVDRTKAAAPPLLLKAGDRYPFKFEFRPTGAGVTVRLGWSSPSQGKETIPARRLFSTLEAVAPMEVRVQANAPIVGRGVMLRNGTFIPATIGRIDEREVKFTYRGEHEHSVPLHQVARLVFRVSARNSLLSNPAQPAGVLLGNGDFVEGEVKLGSRGSVTVSSVLLGLRTFKLDSSDLAALVLQSPAANPARYQLRLADHAIFMARTVNVETNAVTIDEPLAGKFEVPRDLIGEIRGNPRKF